mmetsp:Transcript_876/g.1584  ORF Transcript_876/g.1584 Transcript_876/m.1584 type:complete len:259 (-) Transcript_876:89-865(-)|eukprot:CAMPEP_0116571926 /NCGR_PEP_ID=MMETSP0397-20121206/17868_1 /TAXON_ID=216820 /ORGANISM="Cyclophora tenuis, Strain ECT3854" /LENGTH=258 /DNA_ID=CAMNT_0004100151 /DNA_START=125 /DNA_END=901 /DNA_ORIENTATION=+
MGDNWDDSDDDWDASDSELDARLGMLTTKDAKKEEIPKFDDDEDLALKDQEEEKKLAAAYATKRSALAEKRAAEKERKEEEELVRKAMKMEAEMEAQMDPDQLKAIKRKQIEDADNALTEDLFGGIDSAKPRVQPQVGEKLVLKDLKDHLKHARKVASVLKKQKNIHMATAYLKESIQQVKELLDDAAISELIKTCNVIKNEKVQASKRKVKGQAQKSAKRDKEAEAKARKLQVELYGDNDKYDDYDEYGESYEDAFF